MDTKYRNRNRDKALIGAAIGAATSIIGGIFGNKAKKKQAAAQREADRINALNQQNALDAQWQNQQNAIDAQYQQNVLNVEAQEKLNKEQNDLAAKKTGIENATGLTSLYANENELNKEFRNRFMRCGGKRKIKRNGGRKEAKWGMSDTEATITGAGNLIGGLIGGGSSYTPTATKLNYKTNTYKTYDPANLEVYTGVADKFSGKQVGENKAKYANAANNNINQMTTLGQNPTSAITAATNTNYQPRYRNGGNRKLVKRGR